MGVTVGTIRVSKASIAPGRNWCFERLILISSAKMAKRDWGGIETFSNPSLTAHVAAFSRD